VGPDPDDGCQSLNQSQRLVGSMLVQEPEAISPSTSTSGPERLMQERTLVGALEHLICTSLLLRIRRRTLNTKSLFKELQPSNDEACRSEEPLVRISERMSRFEN
jgi:hypothetical protein